MVALSLVALLVVAALVANRGLAREHKVANKSYTDASAAAGIRNLDPGDGLSRPWVGVCAAVAYLRVNDPQLAAMSSSWHTGAGVIIGADPCATGSLLLSAICTNNSPSTWGWYTGTAGDLTVDVKSGYTTPDPAFDAPGSGDNSATGGCDQLAVIIHQTEAPGLGKVAAGSGNIVTAVRSVARMTTVPGAEASAALLILERTACPSHLGQQQQHIHRGEGVRRRTRHHPCRQRWVRGWLSAGNPVIIGKFASHVSARQSETGTPRAARRDHDRGGQRCRMVILPAMIIGGLLTVSHSPWMLLPCVFPQLPSTKPRQLEAVLFNSFYYASEILSNDERASRRGP